MTYSILAMDEKMEVKKGCIMTTQCIFGYVCVIRCHQILVYKADVIIIVFSSCDGVHVMLARYRYCSLIYLEDFRLRDTARNVFMY